MCDPYMSVCHLCHYWASGLNVEEMKARKAASPRSAPCLMNLYNLKCLTAELFKKKTSFQLYSLGYSYLLHKSTYEHLYWNLSFPNKPYKERNPLADT